MAMMRAIPSHGTASGEPLESEAPGAGGQTQLTSIGSEPAATAHLLERENGLVCHHNGSYTQQQEIVNNKYGISYIHTYSR